MLFMVVRMLLPERGSNVRLAHRVDPQRGRLDRGTAGAAARGRGVAPPGRPAAAVVAGAGRAVRVDPVAAAPAMGVSDRPPRHAVVLAPSPRQSGWTYRTGGVINQYQRAA